MSGLPDQEQGSRLYSESDVQHIVAREVAKQQVRELQSGLLATNKTLADLTANFTTELKSVRELLQKQPDQIRECRVDLRREIEKDFPNRLEMMDMENRIEDMISTGDAGLSSQIAAINVKVDKQWLKITVTLSVISASITGLGVAMNYYLMAAKLLG